MIDTIKINQAFQGPLQFTGIPARLRNPGALFASGTEVLVSLLHGVARRAQEFGPLKL
jgi:hypothetical protein